MRRAKFDLFRLKASETSYTLWHISPVLAFPSASSHHCGNLCGHGDSQSQGSKGEAAGMWVRSDNMLQMTWIQRGYRLRKLSSYVLSHRSALPATNCHCAHSHSLQVCVSSCPRFYSCYAFSQLFSLQTTGSIEFVEMPLSPWPSMSVHGESVYACVPVREQLSHSAITCCTAETDCATIPVKVFSPSPSFSLLQIKKLNRRFLLLS